MLPADIIKSHRDSLIRRILSRNVLLRFRPADRGGRLDVCKIFPQPELIEEKNQVDQRQSCKNPNDFLQRIFVGDTVRAQINQKTGNITNRLIKMNTAATDYKRTAGQWPLVLAWPFLYIPAEQLQGTGRPILAPLFLWRIKVSKLRTGYPEFRLEQDDDGMIRDCELNFVLAEYLKAKARFQLPDEEDIVTILQDRDTTVEVAADKIKSWLANTNVNTQNFTWNLKPCSDLTADGPSLMAISVLGNSYFNYLSLFRDLECLEKRARNGDELGLLSHLFGPVDSDTHVDIQTPTETEQWLVEASDPSQEQAVWQSCTGNTPIIRLEGPPGSGKSQTIVNIVAAALQRKEKVALVCHHTAALNVVYKRLESVKLGDLVVQITAPKENRATIIRKARDIAGLEEEPTGSRDTICEKIRINEGICDARNNAFFLTSSYDPLKTRGHFLAKMDAVKRRTNFDVNFSGNNEFVDIVHREMPDNNECSLLDKIKDIADKWCEHNYPDHLWEQACQWDGNRAVELRAYFDRIIELIRLLDTARLPARGALAYASHPLIVKYYAQITDEPRREVINHFSEVIKFTRAAFSLVGFTPCSSLWELLHLPEEALQKYTEYKNTSTAIPDIISIKNAIKEDQVIQRLAEEFVDQPANWHEIVESAVCKKHYSRLTEPQSMRHYMRAKNSLKEAIEEKKKTNADHLIYRHRKRESIQPIQLRLRNSNLLLLRRGRTAPATTLHKLYHHENGKPVWQLFPGLLANPSSVSQIIPLELGNIDLLVIDEASQMFTADAMPLLYRAKRAVIAGDEHQMPPSDFFALRQIDDYEDDDDDEQQNDLTPMGDVPDELLEAVKMRTDISSALGIHYRSRSAELIAFSNHAFYGGKLQAAPYNGNPLTILGGRPILMKHVDGNFNKGTNDREANAIIEELPKIWKEYPDLSVGIIVFNTTQREQIRSKLVDASSEDDFRNMYERCQNLEQDGENVGLFVRSVEHVQGDERDIIILGTTYGREKRQYGPISTTQLGRRRLNVAVTRAKVGMMIFTSLNIDNISNEGERPDGGDGQASFERWYFWKYMQYARAISEGKNEHAIEILHRINPNYRDSPVGEEPANAFEEQVANFLRDHSFHVDHQVGEGGFRIDLGIKRNLDDSTYLCGVECDGRTYHTGWRARQNDIWRQGILEGKGWRIERIWSDEWFLGTERTRQGFLNRVRGDGPA